MTQKTNERTKRVLLSMDLSTFEVPPAGEVLILGKRCPIGPEAAKTMLDNVAPKEFELIQPVVTVFTFLPLAVSQLISVSIYGIKLVVVIITKSNWSLLDGAVCGYQKAASL